MKLHSIDIPQADTLATIRQLVDAIRRFDNPPVKTLADALNVHERHVRYRIAAARALGFVTAKENGMARITKAFTQIRPTEFVISEGTKLLASQGNYELVSELGRGAVAHVWKATRVPNGTLCAAKIVNPRADLLEPSTFENVKRRFSREAQNGSKLTHENIVSYLDFGEYKGHPFLVMELADESLASRLATKLLTLSESAYVVRCCARGLQHLHQKDCVHRDVKPHNILRFATRYVLGDLGIVNWSDMNPAFTSAGTITRASLQLGSWYYMSPEQEGVPHEATPKSDVYSLGVSWIEMLTRTTSSPAAIGAQAFADPSIDSSVNGIIRRMVRFNPADRPTIDDVLAFLEKVDSTPPRGVS